MRGPGRCPGAWLTASALVGQTMCHTARPTGGMGMQTVGVTIDPAFIDGIHPNMRLRLDQDAVDDISCVL